MGLREAFGPVLQLEPGVLPMTLKLDSAQDLSGATRVPAMCYLALSTAQGPPDWTFYLCLVGDMQVLSQMD